MIHSQSKSLFANAIFQQAIAAFNGADFFGAHELFEDLWRVAPEAERLFLQGLVQIAVAFHHESEGNRTGAESVMRRALKNLSGFWRRCTVTSVATVNRSQRGEVTFRKTGKSEIPLKAAPELLVKSQPRDGIPKGSKKNTRDFHPKVSKSQSGRSPTSRFTSSISEHPK
jgi:hypothetical protein